MPVADPGAVDLVVVTAYDPRHRGWEGADGPMDEVDDRLGRDSEAVVQTEEEGAGLGVGRHAASLTDRPERVQRILVGGSGPRRADIPLVERRV